MTICRFDVQICCNVFTDKRKCNIQEVDWCLRPFCREFYSWIYLILFFCKFLKLFFSMLTMQKRCHLCTSTKGYGFSSISLKTSSCNLAINNILYSGANFVPIVVPRFCSVRVEVATYFSCLKSSRLHRAERPSSCGTLEYKPTTSTVHKVISSDKSKTFLKHIQKNG